MSSGDVAPSRIERAIISRRQAGRRAFVPFLTAGYPDLKTSIDAALALARAGADLLEMGIPFSDPVADGPVIQLASETALSAGTTPQRALELIRAIREESNIPIVIMTYLNPVMQFRGLEGEGFAAAARSAGVDGVLLTDLPPDEPHEIWESVEGAGLDPILLVTPTTAAPRLETIARRARGFVYCVSRLGVTGSGPGSHRRLAELVASARAATRLPVLVGFGIESGPEARRAARVADGIVVGTALIRSMQEAADPVEAVAGLASELIRALTED
jgi:tryptophan synthase alpha chain